MRKLFNLKQWLSLEGAAQRLSTSLNEPVNERDIYQLCAENQLKISVFFPEAVAGYSEGKLFCPCLIGDFIEEFRACLELVYKRKYGTVVVDFNGFDINTIDDEEYGQLVNQTFAAFYDWYSPDAQTALYMEEHILKGLHEIIPDKNPRFFQWLNELALNNTNSIYQGKCHTGVLTFFAIDDYADVTFWQREWSGISAPTREEALENAYIGRFIEDNYSQCKHQRYNPKLSELPNLLVIQTKHLIEFEQSLLDLEYQKNLVPTPSYIDPLNSYYAKELAIAIKAHTAIFINGEGNQHKAAGERVKTWVSEHYPNESKSGAFVDRISSVVLPKK